MLNIYKFMRLPTQHMSEQPLYVVRTAETTLKQLRELVPRLEQLGINVLNAYLIFQGVPTTDYEANNGSKTKNYSGEMDGLELIMAADGKEPGTVGRDLETIFPRAKIYVGTDLSVYISKLSHPFTRILG